MIPETLSRLLGAALMAALLMLTGCAGDKEKPDKGLRKAPQAKPKATVEKPPPEELAKQPCGNPDWAQLPEGAEGKAAREDIPPSKDNDGEGSGADEDDSTGDQSSMNLDGDAPPCT